MEAANPPAGGITARQSTPASALYHERGLAELIANVRVVFALANFPILYLDRVSGQTTGRESLFWIVGVGGMFLAYSLLARWLLVTGSVGLNKFQLWSPVGDVAAACGLILATGGYASPFYLWLLFAVVATGFTPYPLLPLFVAAVVVALQASIALIPQAEPLDASVLAARMVYTLGFGTLIGGVGGYLRRQSRALVEIESVGRQLGDVESEHQAIDVLPKAIADHLQGTRVVLNLPGMPPIEVGDGPAKGFSIEQEITAGGEYVGFCTVFRRKPFGWQEHYFVRVVCDRFASTLWRLRLAEQVVNLATRHERLRFADDLHDKYLQTLAAVDLHAEALRLMLPQSDAPLQDELQTIKTLVRDGAKRARSFIEEQEPTSHGPKSIREILAQRWTGDHTIVIDRKAELSETQWQCVEFLLKEGLNNAKRHGKATQVCFRVEQKDGKVFIALEADGRSPRRDANFGYGLGRVAQMAQYCGGELMLDERVTGGSVLRAVFKPRL